MDCDVTVILSSNRDIARGMRVDLLVSLVAGVQQEESGSSLRGAGWKIVGEVKPEKSGWDRANRKRDWQPIYGQLKFRWEA